jgi:ATP-dependent Clp protease ATP-binding subunit ClpA
MATISSFGANNATAPTNNMLPPTQNTTNQAPDMLINYNENAKKGKFSPILFREKEIESIISILDTNNHPNALITGDAGTGKTKIVEEIARLIETKDPLVSQKLKNATIYELPIYALVAGKSFVGQLEEALKEVIDFASKKKNNVILFIDEVHQLFTGGSNTDEKIAQILKPAMSRGDLRVIGATTKQEARRINKDPAIARRFLEVKIPELTSEQTVEVLRKIAPKFAKKSGVTVPEQIFEPLVRISNESASSVAQPDAAITLLDRAISDAHVFDIKRKLNPSFQKQIANLGNIPNVLNLIQVRKSALNLLSIDTGQYGNGSDRLEKILSERIIGQEEATKALISAVKRNELGLFPRTKPISFLFAGHSGTGKTEISKLLSEALFGNKERDYIYLNMTEFTSSASINRIIGSPDGYVGSDSNQKMIFDDLETSPYKVVVLDEFEKSHPSVQQLFMQALDEGKFETNRHNVVNFKNTIIIATTNAGIDVLDEKHVGFGAMNIKTSKKDLTQALSVDYPPELLNRFEHIIQFVPLSKDDYKNVLKVQYNVLLSKLVTEHVQITPETLDLSTEYNFIDTLAEKSYNAKYNGRPAFRAMQEFLENLILDNPNNSRFDLEQQP